MIYLFFVGSKDSEDKTTNKELYKKLLSLVAEYSGSEDEFEEESNVSVKASESEASSSDTEEVNSIAAKEVDEDASLPNKSLESDGESTESAAVYFPAIEGCRSVNEYEILSRYFTFV